METARRRDTPILLQFEDFASHSKALEISTDFVLVYADTTDSEKTTKRVAFETDLLETGLYISTQTIANYHFVKINVPLEVRYRYAELLKMRMPIKLDRVSSRTFSGMLVFRFLNFLGVKGMLGDNYYTIKTEFKRDKLALFDVDDPEFFSSRDSIAVASYILNRASFGYNKSGILSLLIDGVYLSAYPLHEGSLSNKTSARYLLFEDWALLRNFFRPQPLDQIRAYLGSSFSLFFAWHGFYTFMLIPVAFVGCLSFIVGQATMGTDGAMLDACESNYTMCPKCDVRCPYWQLSEFCDQMKISYAKDAWTAIPLSVFFTLWGVVYMVLWKRYWSHLKYDWGLANYRTSAEPSRPQFLKSMAKTNWMRLNMVTLQLEPYLPFWRMKFPIYLFSIFFTFFVAVLYVCIYAMANIYQLYEDNELANFGNHLQRHCLNGLGIFISIVIFTLFYVASNKVAEVLTNYEKHRTQTQHENSLYLKYYLLEFVLFYTAVIYSAYCKSLYGGHPGHYHRLFGFRPIQCLLDGCQFEVMLCILLFLFLKEVMFIVSISVVPLIRLHAFKIRQLSWWRKIKVEKDDVRYNQMVEDYKLLDSKFMDVYNGYLHTTVIEFGFITMFGVAFPIAPLLVLIVNAFNIRLEAYMYLKFYKRPVPRSVRSTGVWINLADFVCRLAVLTNSLMLAISPKFIPHIIYYYAGLSEASGRGVLKNTLSSFATRDLEEGTRPDGGDEVDVCYYIDYRYPHNHKFKYRRTMFYWKILAARLAFVVVYHMAVYAIINFLQLVIPPIPSDISDKIQMETYHLNKAILKSEKKGND